MTDSVLECNYSCRYGINLIACLILEKIINNESDRPLDDISRIKLKRKYFI